MIVIDNLRFRFSKSEQWVIDGASLAVEAGEFVSVVGKSGCGKSTLLRLVAGLLPIESGGVSLRGKAVGAPTPECMMIFQDYRLLPWLKVKDNITFGLTGLKRGEREERVKRYSKMVGLQDVLNEYPKSLSGGMAQRVALARSLAMRPRVLLMDEPFGALDAFTREELQRELLRLRAETDMTVILVTHSIEEAVFLSDRVECIRAGRFASETPICLEHPRDRNGAEFREYCVRIANEI